MAQTDIVLRNGPLLASTSDEQDGIAVDGRDGPEFVDLIRIRLAALSRMNINCARPWIGTLLCYSKDHRITRLVFNRHLVRPCRFPDRPHERQYHTIGMSGLYDKMSWKIVSDSGESCGKCSKFL